MLSADSFESFTSTGLSWLVSATWKCSLLFLTAGLLSRILSRRPAALRHLVWTTACAGALAAPIVDAAVPGWSLGLLPAAPHAAISPADAETAIPAAEVPPSATEAVAMLDGPALDQAIAKEVLQESSQTTAPDDFSEPVAAASAPPAPAWHVEQLVVSIWLAGTILLFARMLAGYIALCRLERRSAALADHPLVDELARLAREQGIGRPVTIRLASRPMIPMTWGVLRPVVLLPREATSWPADPVRVVLLHELAHIARGDYLTQLIATAARAIHWFNPLAWWALAQLKAEQELACDDRVLAAGTAADMYACELLHVTSQYPRPRFTPSAALAIGRSAQLQRRLETILDDSRSRRPLSRRAVMAAAFVAALAVGGIAPLHVVSATESAPETESASVTPNPELVKAEPASPASATEANAVQNTVSATAGQAATEAHPPAEGNLSEIRSLILKRYVKPADAKGLDEGAIRGMVQSLNDPYSEFLPAEKYRELFRNIEGTLSGIGVQVEPAPTQLNVINPLPGSPAQAAGLVPGDVILAVDGKTVRELGGPAAIEAIRGKAGTAVSLRVLRAGGEEAVISVTRGAIRIPTIRGLWMETPSMKWNYWLDPQQKLAYVQIAEFGKETARDFREIIQTLLAEGLKGLVLDLRGSPGGLLTSAVEAANLFLREGTIVTARGAAAEQILTYSADPKLCLGDFPLIVIADDRTASAAEIFVGALKDNGRATVVGMRTFGKGSVQEIVRIGEAGALKLTTAHFFLPNGRRIHRETGAETWGIDPTEGFVVTLTPEQQERRIKEHQKYEQIGDALRGLSSGGPQAIASGLESILGDLQLAVAYKCLSARVGGAAVKAGQSEQAVKDQLAHRERLIKARAEAQKQIEQIDKELSTPRGGR